MIVTQLLSRLNDAQLIELAATTWHEPRTDRPRREQIKQTIWHTARARGLWAQTWARFSEMCEEEAAAEVEMWNRGMLE